MLQRREQLAEVPVNLVYVDTSRLPDHGCSSLIDLISREILQCACVCVSTIQDVMLSQIRGHCLRVNVLLITL